MTANGSQSGAPVLSELANRAHLANKAHRTSTQLAALSSAKQAQVDPATYVPRLEERFEILDRVRTDSTGIVFKVFDSFFERVVAIRVLPYFNLSQSIEARLVRDFRAMMNLRHPNILDVLDFGKTIDGAPYMVTEYVDGEALSTTMDRLQQVSPERAEIIFLQLTDALMHAHSLGTLHRDIKPSNVLITVDANGDPTVKLMDFGISRTVAENIHARQKETEAHGSKLYSSPEQIRGNVFDARSDLYSLGCVVYEMLAGRPAFENDDAHLNLEPSPLRTKKSGRNISKQLESCVFRCLEKDASVRVKDAEALFFHLTDANDPSLRPTLRPTFPWKSVLKWMAICSTAYLPFFISKTFTQPLWLCIATYVMAIVVAVLIAAQDKDLGYRLRTRTTPEPDELPGRRASSESVF